MVSSLQLRWDWTSIFCKFGIHLDAESFESTRSHNLLASVLARAFRTSFMSLNIPCAIPADPDISGIGVRVAIYAQNLLSFVPAIWALWDGDVSDYELESIETQSTTILITAFAILISAMVQARTAGLTNFHATIVLDLSWMNNTNTFIYFLLYVQHKSQPGPGQIKSDLSSWINHLKDRLAGSLSLKVDGSHNVEGRLNCMDSELSG
jgi:hypothetical protein